MIKRFLLILILLLPLNVFALDRCNDYIPDVRAQHIRYFGLSYPWWYGVGQLKQESKCRDKVTAFDLGQGAAQFMPVTTKYVRKLMNEPQLNPYQREDALKMQAFYMSYLHKHENKFEGKPLWLTYQGYNGGFSLLYKESQRSGNSDWKDMKKQCRRKVLTLKNGNKLDLCDVNYDYSKRVYKYGNAYRTGEDRINFW